MINHNIRADLLRALEGECESYLEAKSREFWGQDIPDHMIPYLVGEFVSGIAAAGMAHMDSASKPVESE